VTAPDTDDDPMKTARSDIHAYITKDGSQIRELMHPSLHGGRTKPRGSDHPRRYAHPAASTRRD